MKWKILSLLLAICVMLPLGANSASAAGATPFEDVRDSDWYANAVQYVYKEGLFNGTSTVTFSPIIGRTWTPPPPLCRRTLSLPIR